VFVTGTGRLEPGRRYSIVLQDSSLRFLGPTDVDPTALVVERPIAHVDAQAFEGRLLLSEPRTPSGMVLAFMSVAPPGTEAVAEAIARAARQAAAL
jgi:hypothetical protein